MDGGAPAVHSDAGHHADHGEKKGPTIKTESRAPTLNTTTTASEDGEKQPDPPMSPFQQKINASWRKHQRRDTDLEDYFFGPRAVDKHSKWPIFMQVHGSIMPEMILPILFVAGWATAITCISKFVRFLGISNVLLTVLGLVIGLALSFRTSASYERYTEGRKYWAQLSLTSNTLARYIWLHTKEREGDLGKQDLLAKLGGLNMIVAFSVALKHRLRFEPHTCYSDLENLVAHLDTYAKEATTEQHKKMKAPNKVKRVGEHLGVSFATSNPRKLLKNADKPLGNLPLEILSYLSTYLQCCIEEETLGMPWSINAVGCLATMNDVLTGTERVLNTPLPIAYSIAVSQITWLYVVCLPFQLLSAFDNTTGTSAAGWITIPATVVAAYIILGIALIGREIENPFGNDVNDLPLESFCEQLAGEIDVLTSRPKQDPNEFFARGGNLPLWPLNNGPHEMWMQQSKGHILEALAIKPQMAVAERAELKRRETHVAANDHV